MLGAAPGRRAGERRPHMKNDDQAARAHELEEEAQHAKEEMKRLEEDPPERLEDWPEGQAKYHTLGGEEHESSYEEAPTAKLGPSDVRHHEDGSVTVGGEKVDNPEDFKGEPIPGGPTDPDAERLAHEESDGGGRRARAPGRARQERLAGPPPGAPAPPPPDRRPAPRPPASAAPL